MLAAIEATSPVFITDKNLSECSEIKYAIFSPSLTSPPTLSMDNLICSLPQFA